MGDGLNYDSDDMEIHEMAKRIRKKRRQNWVSANTFGKALDITKKLVTVDVRWRVNEEKWKMAKEWMSIPMITKAERGPSLEIDLKVIFAVKHGQEWYSRRSRGQ